jgi:hypothetical protein
VFALDVGLFNQVMFVHPMEQTAPTLYHSILHSLARLGMPILNEGAWHGRRGAIFVECDAGLPIAAVAEPLSAVAAGDLFGPEGRDGAGAGLLESLLEGEETILAVPSMDARDEELHTFWGDIVAVSCA